MALSVKFSKYHLPKEIVFIEYIEKPRKFMTEEGTQITFLNEKGRDEKNYN